MNDLQGRTTKDVEGQENMRRARDTLRPGDVIRYVYERDAPLIMVLSVDSNGVECYRLAFHGRSPRLVQYVMHGDWELCGHIDNWQALVEEEPCLSWEI